MEIVKSVVNNILPTELSTTSAVVLFSNPSLPTKLIPFVLTGTDSVFQSTPEGDYTGHTRCQGRGYKMVHKTKEGVSNAKNFTIPVQYIDPSYQILTRDFMAYAADIANNQIYYLNSDPKILQASAYTMVNLSNPGGMDASSFLQPTTLVGNGNLSGGIDLGQIIAVAMSVVNLLTSQGVSANGVAKYMDWIQNFENQALMQRLI